MSETTGTRRVHRRGRALLRVAACVAALAGAGMTSVAAQLASGVSGAGATAPAPTMRVGDWTNQRILSFPLPSTGNVSPSSTLTQVLPQGYTGLAYDASGDLWGVTTEGNQIVEFTPTQLSAGGPQVANVTIVATDPTALAFDGAGDLWVTLGTTNQLVEYPPDQQKTGGTPSVTISSDTTTVASLSFPSAVAVDANGDVWVANTTTTSLSEFAPTQLTTTGAPQPKVVINGPTTGLDEPYGLAFDATGNLWVTNQEGHALLKFAPSALASSGNPKPATTITYGGTQWQPAFDTAGNLWVPYTTSDEVAEWSPSQQSTGGSLTPTKLIKGATTTFARPEGLALTVKPTVTAVAPAQGVKGSTVTIHGTGFTSATTVKFGSQAAGTVTVVSPFTLTAKVPAGSGTQTVTATNWVGTSTTSKADQFTYQVGGYDLAGADGGVFVFPVGLPSGFFGSLPGIHVVPNTPVVGLVATVTHLGYFLTAADGGVFAFGTAPFLGSLPGIHVHPRAPITGIIAADTDRGYFLVGRDGGVFAFGTVPFLGSLPGRGVSVDNIVGIAATPTGNGYWLVSSTGTVYNFGSAQHLGTEKNAPSPISAIAGTPTGGGYWITTDNGSVYNFGNAHSFSTLPAMHVTPNLPVIGIVHTADTGGYWLIAKDGGIFAFGDAGFVGSLPGLGISVKNIVGAVPT